MAEVKLKIVSVGLESSLLAVVKSEGLNSKLVESISDGLDPQTATRALVARNANCVFLDPLRFDWRETEELLQLCTETFPVCVIRSSAFESRHGGNIPSQWVDRLRDYYNLLPEAPLQDLEGQIDYAIRGCQRYLLKKVIQANLNQIASESSAAPEIVDKARQAAVAIKEIESEEKGGLGRNLGLTEEQMKSLFNDTLGDLRRASQRSELANFIVLGVGLLIVLTTACVALFSRANAWTLATGGMGAAALISALVTSPSSRLESIASRQHYIMIAYFGFLNQVVLLAKKDSISTVIERSKRLEDATKSLLQSLNGLQSRPDNSEQP